MKIDLYIDIYPHWKKNYELFASTSPKIKQDGVKRYKATVNIPFNGFDVDGAAPVEEVFEVDND